MTKFDWEVLADLLLETTLATTVSIIEVVEQTLTLNFIYGRPHGTSAGFLLDRRRGC